jgi:hypothetical protein
VAAACHKEIEKIDPGDASGSLEGLGQDIHAYQPAKRSAVADFASLAHRAWKRGASGKQFG